MKAWVVRMVAAGSVALALVAVAPVTSYADGGHHGTSSGTTRTPEQQYEASAQLIDRHFLKAVAQAKQALRAALLNARNPGQRSTARAKYGLAIAEATTERDDSLVQLGPPPVTTSVQNPFGNDN